MNKYKKLMSNSIIFALGNFGSKVLQFLLVPLYSYTLTTEEFGKVDIYTTLVSLIAPMICLNIYDAVFRFSLDEVEDKKRVFSTGFFFALGNILIGIILCIFVSKFVTLKTLVLVSILIVANIFYSLILNFVRAIGKSKLYAVGGVINTGVLVVSNILLLLFLKMGISGYIFSMFISMMLVCLIVFVCANLKKYLSIYYIDKGLYSRMVKYSLPLMPNTLAWWLNSSSDRVFILYFIDVAANGIYAMASKVPNLLSMVINIFFQAWQMSVVEEYSTTERNLFISKVFDLFVGVISLGGVLILGIIRPMFATFIENSYYDSWKLVPIFIFAISYSGYASFWGTIYTALKRTTYIFVTTVTGALVNIILTIGMIQFLGVYGAVIANVISFLLVFVLRYINLKRNEKVEIKYHGLVGSHIILILATISIYIVKNDVVQLFVCIGLCIIFILSNRTVIKDIIYKFFGFYKKENDV